MKQISICHFLKPCQEKTDVNSVEEKHNDRTYKVVMSILKVYITELVY